MHVDVRPAQYVGIFVTDTGIGMSKAIVHQGRLDADVEVVFEPFTYSQLAAKIRHALDG
jgi:hypothetical protein